jgi:hypothetical protein
MADKTASAAAAVERQSHLSAVAAPADPLFLATSVEWIMDASIPIEIRVLCQMITAKALIEAKAEGRDFTAFGRDQVTAKLNVDWIIQHTGWPKNKAESVRAEALEKGYLSATGSARTGYQYTVMLPLRTHRATAEVPLARSMFASERVAPKPKPTGQLELGDVSAAVQPPPDMKRWSRADREFYSRSSGAIRTVFSRLSGADRRLFSRLSGANQELFSRTPGANSELLARLSGANDELYSRRSGAKKGLIDVRARSQESRKNPYQKLLAEVLTPEMRSQLLLLARKREEDTEEDSRTFVGALGRIVENLVTVCDNDVDLIRATLARVLTDERVTSHENPIALLQRGICNKPRFLLNPKSASRMGKTPDERAFYLLPQPVQHLLLERIERGGATAEWCRERDISDGARRVAAALIAKTKPPEPLEESPLPPAPSEVSSLDSKRLTAEQRRAAEEEAAERSNATADAMLEALSPEERAEIRNLAESDKSVVFIKTSLRSAFLYEIQLHNVERTIVLSRKEQKP